MSSINSIIVEKFARLIGTPKCPALIDVCIQDGLYRWTRDATGETNNWLKN